MACPRPSRPPDIRLQRHLAACGLGSRRSCEELIAAGRVAVDGITVREPGVRIDPARQVVALDGVPVQAQPLVHLALNKPRGYLCTSRDPRGRPTFHALLPDLGARLYSAGRLDGDSEGLLVVTNDGDLVARLTHARHGVRKRYRVWVDRTLSPQERRRAVEGVESRGETLRLLALSGRGRTREGFLYEAVLVEGRNREIRRVLGALGRTVLRLQRVAVGPLELGGLRAGAWRHLRPEETAALRKAASDPKARAAHSRAIASTEGGSLGDGAA